jgi:transcription elongation factor Elf1
MAQFHCLYCGTDRSSISSLTSSSCSKNPEGKYHVPYEGSEKSKYTCKYCGTDRSSISSLTSSSCSKNPKGKYHIPAM